MIITHRLVLNSICTAVFLLIFALMGQSQAQNEAGSFDADQFIPNVDFGGLAVVERANTYKLWDVHAGMYLDFADDVLVTSRKEGDDYVDEEVLIDSRISSDIVASITVWEHMLIGLGFPVIFGQEGGVYSPSGKDEGDALGIGDIALRARGIYRFPEDTETLGVGLGMLLTFPSGDEKSYQGAPGVTGGPRLLFDVDLDIALIALNVGFVLREGDDQIGIDLGHEARYALGTMFRLIDGEDLLYASAEFAGAVQINSANTKGTCPLELLFGLGYQFDFGFIIGAGAGPGLAPGYGTPDVRVFGLLGYAPRHFDTKPKPEEVEAKPLRDWDNDGVFDMYDRCPVRPEDIDSFEDNDGCPDDDNDADGILDIDDECPTNPEDHDGIEDEDGCPEQDTDGDGISDRNDKCPEEMEDMDGFEDEDGCVEVDNDGDMLQDEVDKCPMLAETSNGVKDEDGCPDYVQKKDDLLIPLKTVAFSGRKQEIQPVSRKTLNEVASLIKAHPEWELIKIEAHMHALGDDDGNLARTEQRAKQVLMYLINAGVDPERLGAQGFGETRPVADNDNAEGRAKNERVEFRILGGE